jgi:transcriptional regulator with XRE-family HTH domain
MQKTKSTFTRNYGVFVRLLRQKRKDAGVTQVKLAKMLNDTQAFVSRNESRERRVDLIELEQICGCLGIGLDEFVADYLKAKAKSHPSKPKQKPRRPARS